MNDEKWKKKKILIVDDSPESIEVLGNALPKNYMRQIALNGDRALKLLAASEELPDLILLDVIMPEMDGYEFCKELKKDDKLKNIPVIFLSSLSNTNDKIMAFQNGAVDYIQKPFEIEEVQARVKTHLRLYDLQVELENQNKYLNELVEKKAKEISEFQMATIYALAKLAESRDDSTGKHLERVQVFCKLLVEKLSIDNKYKNEINPEFVENIQKASPLHDIGKVGIEDAIMLKPGKLTAEEFERMKQHTVIGSNTLKEVNKKHPDNYFIKMGIEIAQSHHEKWDGSGYPEGLIAEEIPLSARIMALVDVYDALRSKRVYKETYSHEKACDIIIQGRGKQFDPLIVDVFLESEQEFEKVYKALKIYDSEH
ncbi:MAG: response regulator [Alkaliphilus sp.]|nr:response regulator [Alkaliphilus sp.]